VTRLFVYGTLRQGYYNYDRFQLARNARYRGVTVMRGARLFDLGQYPCMVLTSDVCRQVVGELLEVDDETIVDEIRRMEEEAGYRTATVDTAAGPAVTFVFDRPPAGAVEVASGDWAEVDGGSDGGE